MNLFSALFTDMLLLSLFVLQHSAMASGVFKRAVHKMGLSDITRSIYIVGTAAVLWVRPTLFSLIFPETSGS